MSEVRIRAGVARDAPAVLELWAAAGAAPSATDDVESIERLVGHDPGSLAVAEVGGALAGTLVAAFDGWRAAFYRLAVHPDHRRRGVALALVRHGEARLRAVGARRVAAIVLEGHADAVGFWRAAGYARQDEVGRYTRDLLADDGPQPAEC